VRGGHSKPSCLLDPPIPGGRPPHPLPAAYPFRSSRCAALAATSANAMITIAHPITRPGAVEPGINVVDMQPNCMTRPASVPAAVTTADAEPADSRGTARTAASIASAFTKAPSPQHRVSTHAATTPSPAGAKHQTASETAGTPAHRASFDRCHAFTRVASPAVRPPRNPQRRRHSRCPIRAPQGAIPRA